jgi:O-antigen ligase
MATLMACLAMLSQSRGTALAMLGSVAVVLAFAPGRTRRVYGLAVIAAGVALAAPHLLSIYEQHATGAIPVAAGHAAGRAALVSALVVAAAWAALIAGWQQVCNRTTWSARARKAGSWLLVVPVVLALAVAVLSAHRIERGVRDQWHAFTHLAEQGESGAAASVASRSRLLSGAGNRYDYWRIAWRVWGNNPVLGVGAGNYARPYYEQRATTEDIDQPHSIELQTLSELGLVGALLLAAFLAGVALGAARIRRRAAGSPLSRALMVGAVGAFIAWLVQTSVDWMHLLPGLTAIALAAVAVLVRPSRRRSTVPDGAIPRSPARRALTGRPALVLGACAVIVTLIVAGASLSRQGIADIYRSRAQSELASNPGAALTDVNRSLDIDSDVVQSYYVKAAALARVDEASTAEAALGRALELEPGNFVTWALLGDIATREHRPTAARRYYLRAHLLNPRDEALRELALGPGV